MTNAMDDPQRVRFQPVTRTTAAHEERRRAVRSGRVANGTLACNRCDAPVALTAGPVPLTQSLSCPYCAHRAPARDFLSLSDPSRPARVAVRIVDRARLSRA
jgi:hypothetical protein